MAIVPPLKWAGGKRWLVPHLASLWQQYKDRRLVEPFCGGLGVALGLLPQKALLNDINPHLINFYQQLKDGFQPRFTPSENNKALFYEHRERFNAKIVAQQTHTPESASLFYYLNRTCFNGLCRFNRKGLFNVPFGAYKTIHYLSGNDFRKYERTFAQWVFSHGDFSRITITEEDFIYADPPYDVPFTSYAQEDFLWKDQERLVKWLTQFSVPIVLSNQCTPRIVELYQDYGFILTLIQAPRRISANGNRTPAQEVLALRNITQPEARLRQKMLL